MARNVIGLFDNPNDAQAALRDLENAGFRGTNVGLLRNVAGGSAGIFEQLGIPPEDAAIYREGVRNGGALVILQQLADDDAYRAAEMLNRHNIVDIDRAGRRSQQTTETTSSVSAGATAGVPARTRSGSGASSFYQGGEAVIPIIEEEVRVGKREVETGGVRVSTRVEEQPVQEQVTLRDEDVRVERRPVDRPVDTAAVQDALREGTFEVRERREEPVVDKQARVVEEVVVGKEVQERTETVSETARRTDVDVQEVPGETRTSGSSETGRTSARAVSGVGTTSSTRDEDVARTGSDEGPIERTLGNAKAAAERATGLDLDRSGEAGDRDRRDNF